VVSAWPMFVKLANAAVRARRGSAQEGDLAHLLRFASKGGDYQIFVLLRQSPHALRSAVGVIRKGVLSVLYEKECCRCYTNAD
jgi:hypothetical protein